MNHSALKLFAMTLTAAALAVSTAQANPQQWLGENVPFDAAADEPQPDVTSGSDFIVSAQNGPASKWLGENVPFDDAYEAEPVYTAFESNFPADETHVAGLLLDLPADDVSETAGFPAMPDFVVDDQPILIAGLDSLQTP